MLLIPAPNDVQIYRCCRAIAKRLRERFTRERLLLEQGLPLSAGLCDPEPPAAIGRVLEHGSTLIACIALEVGGLHIEYRRSGGHDPFRESYFDEVQVAAVDDLELSEQEIKEVLVMLYQDLRAAAVHGSLHFSELFEAALQAARCRGSLQQLNRSSQ